MKIARTLKIALTATCAALALGCAPMQAGGPAPMPSAVAGKAQLLWLGQASFRITSPGGKNIMMDGPADMMTPMETLGIIPAELTHRFNKSGSVTPLPGIKVTSVKAEHSSLLVFNNPASGKQESHPAGEAVGYIIELENGLRIWHMGETGLFGDMKFIGDYYKPDVVLIPIGGNFTMGPEEAAYAVKTWINPKYVVPMHYNSNPLAAGTLAQFQAAMQGSTVRVLEMKEGETFSF